MRIYYEAKEVTTDPEAETEFARIDVTYLTDKERDGVLVNLKSLMPKAIYTRHECNHDYGGGCDITNV